MSGTLRDNIKTIVRDIINGKPGSTTPSKYRLGTVSAVNVDGTVDVQVDGNSYPATQVYPVVKGQQVVLAASDGGVYSAIPTLPAPDKVTPIHPPFFSGGVIRLAWAETSISPTPIWAIRLQEVGNANVFRFIVPQGPATSSFFKAGPVAFSPNGQYLAYTCGAQLWNTQSQGPLPVTAQTKIGVVKLGQALKKGDGIPGFPQGFLLDATEKISVPLFGFQLVLTQFPLQAAVSNDIVAYQVSSLFVDNTGTPFWTEIFLMYETNAGSVVTGENFFYHTATMTTLCTVDKDGNRVVISSVQGVDAEGTVVEASPTGPLISGTVVLQGTSLGGCNGNINIPNGSSGVLTLIASVQVSAFLLDPVANVIVSTKLKGFPTGTFTNPPTRNIPLPVPAYSITDVYTLSGILGIVQPPLLAEYDDGTPSEFLQGGISFSKSKSFVGLLHSSNFYVISEQLIEGTVTILRYTVQNLPAMFNFIFLGNGTDQEGMIIPDPNNVNGVVLQKVQVDNMSKTILVTSDQDNQFIVTPKPPDTNYTKYNPRTATLDSFSLNDSSVPSAVGFT